MPNKCIKLEMAKWNQLCSEPNKRSTNDNKNAKIYWGICEGHSILSTQITLLIPVNS